MGGLGIYLHLPFCARRCDYCDFFVVVEGRRPASFLTTLHAEIAAAGALRAAWSVDSIYLGGGTPSAMQPEEIAAIMAETRAAFRVAQDAEITLEANPEGVTPESAAAWRAAGVTRVSLGVQSLRDDVLRPRGRVYTGREALEAARVLRRCGPEALSFDLIAGLPGESPESFRQGVGRLLELEPDHMSVYLLETEESGKESALSDAVRAGRETLCAEEDLVTMYESAVAMIPAAGLPQYEISNFARPGRASRHNLKYWTGGDYLGLGPSAHSSLEGRRFARPRDMAAWERQVSRGEPGSDYTLPAQGQRLREALILALRLTQGVDLPGLLARNGLEKEESLECSLRELVDDRLLEHRAGRLALTRRGTLMSNEVFLRLL